MVGLLCHGWCRLRKLKYSVGSHGFSCISETREIKEAIGETDRGKIRALWWMTGSQKFEFLTVTAPSVRPYIIYARNVHPRHTVLRERARYGSSC